MKPAIAFCMLFLAALALAQPDDNHYTDKYDNVNLGEILGNRKVLEGYMKCILDQGKCTANGKELKDHIREALETGCTKCTEAQKKKGKGVLKHVINNEEAYWNELTDKYDPDKKYATKYEKELREVQA